MTPISLFGKTGTFEQLVEPDFHVTIAFLTPSLTLKWPCAVMQLVSSVGSKYVL
jgi:hypothetical protein